MAYSDIPNKINVAGLIKSTLKKGFSTRDSLSELIDNSCDARAKQCRVDHYINKTSPLYPKKTGETEDTIPKRPFMVFSDDGKGMPLEVANACLTIHNEKEASADKNGFAGIGLSHSLANLTQLKDKTLILTKEENGDIIEVLVNWTEARQNGHWCPMARDLSTKYQKLWEDYAIDKEHGTVLIIELDDHVSADLISKADDIYDDFAKTYSSYGDLDIHLKLTSEESVVVEYVDVLNTVNVPDDAYHSTHMEVFRTESETRVYYKNDLNEMVRVDFANPRGEKFKDYPPVGGEFVKVCDIELASSFLPVTEEDAPARQQGATYFQRGFKLIANITNPSITAGDFDKRKVHNFANHVVKYNYHGDAVFKTQMNKSRLSVDNIDNTVWKTIEFLKKYWCDKYIKRHHVVKPRGPQDALMKKVKAWIANDEFRMNLSMLIDEFEAIPPAV